MSRGSSRDWNPADPSAVRLDGPWQHRDVRADGIRFHTVETGTAAPDAPLVILLHGYADCWWSWRHQLVPLTEAGTRAVAIDLRGYGDTDKPPRGYDGWTLAEDVAGLIRAHGARSAFVVGHSDGGLVAWATALLHPELVSGIATINAPHPLALISSVMHDPHQRRALLPSFLRAQEPWRPERRLVAGRARAVEQIVGDRVGREFRASAEFAPTIEFLRTAMTIPGAAHSMLEYQRWAFRSQFRPDGRRFRAAMRPAPSCPTLQIHGENDPFVLGTTVAKTREFVPEVRTSFVPHVAHYAHWEAPQAVTDELAGFVTA